MKKTSTIFLLILLILPLGINAAEQFKVGDQVPDFNLPYATKDTIVFEGIKNGDLMGSRYILAFYPADWSPGCTHEMCTFRDEFSDFSKLNVEILAISGDYVFSHHEWAKYHNLEFKLLSDHDGGFGKKLGVYNEKYSMFNRSVFVVGPDGRFEYIDYDYSLKDDRDFRSLQTFLTEKR